MPVFEIAEWDGAAAAQRPESRRALTWPPAPDGLAVSGARAKVHLTWQLTTTRRQDREHLVEGGGPSLGKPNGRW